LTGGLSAGFEQVELIDLCEEPIGHCRFLGRNFTLGVLGQEAGELALLGYGEGLEFGKADADSGATVGGVFRVSLGSMVSDRSRCVSAGERSVID
jgi:hypothetical protein